MEEILPPDRDRWAVDIGSRDANAVSGRGHEQCRQVRRIVGAHIFRLAMAAAHTLGFLDQAHRTDAINRRRSRPWPRQQCAPSQLDIAWACREALYEAGVFPLRLTDNHDEPANVLPAAA